MARLALEVGQAAAAEPLLQATISVSRANERFEDYLGFGPSLFPVSTFESAVGSAAFWRLRALRRALAARLEADRIETVVTLMPHVWSPFVFPVLRKAHVRTYAVVHDGRPHPGDPTAAIHRWCHRDLPFEDRIVTLSQAVTDCLVADRCIPTAKILTLFHPTFAVSGAVRSDRSEGAPFRLLFAGRILPYKGLPLLVDALEILQRERVPVALTVAGEGDIAAPLRARLEELGARVVNRWLTDAELDELAASHDALALSHIEASQSGVAALALGRRLPVVATPVGGLVRQVEDGRTGLLAASVDASAFAAAVRRLATDGDLYSRIAGRSLASDSSLTMAAFVQRLARDIAGLPPLSQDGESAASSAAT